ncbi:MAG: hypothetical protein AB2556_11950 [Candidatus Thiodiazotropha sp.]
MTVEIRSSRRNIIRIKIRYRQLPVGVPKASLRIKQQFHHQRICGMDISTLFADFSQLMTGPVMTIGAVLTLVCLWIGHAHWQIQRVQAQGVGAGEGRPDSKDRA